MQPSLSPEQQARVDQLIAYLDGLLCKPQSLNKFQTAVLRDRLDVVLNRDTTPAKEASAVLEADLAPVMQSATPFDDEDLDDEGLSA